MPLFELACCNCGHTEEKLLTHADLDKGVFCDLCGYQMNLQWSRPAWFRPGKYGKGGGVENPTSAHAPESAVHQEGE